MQTQDPSPDAPSLHVPRPLQGRYAGGSGPSALAYVAFVALAPSGRPQGIQSGPKKPGAPVAATSAALSKVIAERRAEAGGLETVALIFPGATHALSGTGVQRTEGEFRYDEPTLEAQQQIWPATLEFFATHLKR